MRWRIIMISINGPKRYSKRNAVQSTRLSASRNHIFLVNLPLAISREGKLKYRRGDVLLMDPPKGDSHAVIWETFPG